MITTSHKNCDNYINALEIIYSIILTIGMTMLLSYVSLSPFYWFFFLNCLFLLTRFFFAPSKNIKPLINEITYSKSLSDKQKDFHYGIALIIDVAIVLFAHALLLILIFLYGGYWSSNIDGYFKLIKGGSRVDYALYTFIFTAALLFINSLWLVSIDFRRERFGGKSKKSHSNWAFNNLCFFAIMLALLLPYYSSPVFQNIIENSIGINVFFFILTIIVIFNSVIDLYKNASTYLFDEK